LGARRDTTARTYVNPLFAYSSIADERCALPAGMNPLSGFQVTSALVDTLAPVSEGLSAYSNTLTAEEKAIRVVTYTKDQFKARCSAFQNSPSVTIYHYNDEVVRICYSLQSRLDSSVANIYDYCSAPWNPPRELKDFDVDQSPYGPFDVIETSSLADEMALPILLISTLPLLKKSREATLYTTSLVPADDTPHDQRLRSLLYCEPLTMFALLSCVPSRVRQWVLQ
jgi:hypothetical protein